MVPTRIAYPDLKLGDVIECFEGPYGTATVTKVTDEEIYLLRAYVHTADFSYTGGVLAYLGFEECRWFRNARDYTSPHTSTPRTALVYQRSDLK